jgi:putative transposase
MKNTLLLDNYYYPEELKTQISTLVEYYNYQRYHESLKNVTPADVYQGRAALVLEQREMIKRENHSKKEYLQKTVAIREVMY